MNLNECNLEYVVNLTRCDKKRFFWGFGLFRFLGFLTATITKGDRGTLGMSLSLSTPRLDYSLQRATLVSSLLVGFTVPKPACTAHAHEAQRLLIVPYPEIYARDYLTPTPECFKASLSHRLIQSFFWPSPENVKAFDITVLPKCSQVRCHPRFKSIPSKSSVVVELKEWY
jgi:hypothetical protein